MKFKTYVEDKGFSVVKDFCGHGISTVLFTNLQIFLHYGKKNTGSGNISWNDFYNRTHDQ